MAKGTAVAALEASSEIWTQESNPPILQTGESQATVSMIKERSHANYECESIRPAADVLPSTKDKVG
jgi:hypothetical protein